MHRAAGRLLCCYCSDTDWGERESGASRLTLVRATKSIPLTNPGESRVEKARGNGNWDQTPSTFPIGRWHLTWKSLCCQFSRSSLSLKLTSCKPRSLGRVHGGDKMGANMTIPHLLINLGEGTMEEISILESLSLPVAAPHFLQYGNHIAADRWFPGSVGESTQSKSFPFPPLGKVSLLVGS